MKPYPVKNPENFTRMGMGPKNPANIFVVKDVNGSGGGKVYKIKAEKTPFVIRCLQHRMDMLNAKEQEKEQELENASSSTTQKRSHSESEDGKIATKKSK